MGDVVMSHVWCMGGEGRGGEGRGWCASLRGPYNGLNSGVDL